MYPTLQGGSVNLQGSSYNPQQTAPSTVLQDTATAQQLQPTVNPYTVQAPTGPSAAELAAQEAARQEAVRRQAVYSTIDSQFGDWTNRLNTNEQRVREAEGRALGQVDQNYNFQYGQGERGYGIGNQNLQVARDRVQDNRRVTVRDLINELRTAQDAGQVQLGAYGAGDSSAVDMMAMGYGRAATTANQDVQRQVGQQTQDIGLQQTALDAEWENTKSSLNNWKNNQLFQIGESVRQQMQAINDERQTASAARQQALNQIEAGVIQNAMQAAQGVQQQFNLTVGTAPQANTVKMSSVNYTPVQLQNSFGGAGQQLSVGRAQTSGVPLAVRRPDENY